MKNRVLLLATVVAMMFGFVSCQKEKDTEKAKINLIAPEEHEAIKPGSDVHFEVELSDNEALGSYKVNIHYAGDGHTHISPRRQAENSVEFGQTWLEQDFINAGEREAIEGKLSAHIHHHHITIPADINGKQLKEGHYHFMVYCTDKAGNEAFVAREIEISYSAEEHDHDH